MSTPSTKHPTTPSTTKPTDGKKSETVQLLIQMWSVMVLLELVHQIFNVVIGLIDPSALRAVARQQAVAEGQSDAIVNATVTTATLLMGLLNLAIVGILAWMIMIVNKRSKRIPTAFLLLTVFSFFFIFRTLLVFLSTPGGGDVPVAFYAVDGSIQILIGVVGVIAYLLSRQPEVVEWVGPRK